MTKRNSGLAFHVHHDRLWEWCYNYDERLRAIEQKPTAEIPTRKRLFKIVDWPNMPADVREAGAAYNKAGAALEKAGAAYNKAGAALDKAVAALDKPRAAYNKAGAALNKPRATYNKAGEALERVLQEHFLEIDVLHAAQCQDCPWDGKTIFPTKEGRI